MSSVLSEIIDKFNKKNVSGCKYIFDSLYFDCQNMIKLCPYTEYGIINNNFDGIWLDIDKINTVRGQCKQDFESNTIPNECKSCHNYSRITKNDIQALKYLYIANWQHCYLNCTYCDYPKIEDLKEAKHYDIFPSIKQLLEKNVIDKKTKIIFECGDPCIHPEFDKILFYFINYEMEDIVIHTPAMRYCESISEAIAKNIAKVVVSFDSGCPYIYGRVKGTNKYDIAMNNIKRYLSFQEPNQKRVLLEYKIINGINDNQKEILDWFIMARDTGIKKLAIDVEQKWYNQIKISIPQYLKELILFAKDISEFNNLEIEFYENANAIYEKIKKEEK